MYKRQLLGLGPNGHIGFNEPGEAFELETHCVNLTPATIEAMLSRLKLYRHISKEEALRRLRHQLPQQEKIKRADVVFYNNSDSASLKRQICDIPVSYTHL